jgi:predicted amidohydrolase YtcJ
MSPRHVAAAGALLAWLGSVTAAGGLLTWPDPVAAAPPHSGEFADLELTGGTVRTPDGTAQALAMRRGVIVAVGDAAAVQAWRGPSTQVIDLKGRTVLPGLHDVHVHPIFGGMMQHQCVVAQGASLAVLTQGVRACAAQRAPGEWITGGQWDAPALGRAPDRRDLDAVSGEHPVLLDDTSGHSSWANSRALSLAGITAATPDPAGGIIERGAHGRPTGVLRESAIDLVRAKIPTPTEAAVKDALAWSLHTMLGFGITSYTDAAIGFIAGPERELAAYDALADAGVLKQRVTLCITWQPGSTVAEDSIARRNLYARDRVRPDCVKIFLDGVPTDGHTAAMLEPYADTVAGRTDAASRYGLLLVKQPELDAAVTRFDRMGLTVKFHAAGDAAVRAGLDAIEAARKANGFSGLMHNAGHCTFVSAEDIPRARRIGATFEVSPYLWAPSPINDSITAAVGPELIKRVWPVREMLDSGALVVPGSDWAVVPSVNPWIGIETLVTRETPGGSTRSFGKAQAISLPEAMQMFTSNAARQERASDRLGSLATGMLADMIVVDQDPYGVAPTQLHATQVEMTFIGGEKVFDRDAPAAR